MPRYGKAAGKSVRSAMRRKKHGTLRSGRASKGGRVRSRKQAIAIGLSEGRKSSREEIVAPKRPGARPLQFTASVALRYGPETKSNSRRHGRQSNHRWL